MQPQVCFYRNFHVDQRTSMEVYADAFIEALAIPSDRVTQLRPSTARSGRMGMRYARYVEYPRLVRQQQAEAHHVLDHGYAHLVKDLGSGTKILSAHDLIPLLHSKGLLVPGSHRRHLRKPWLNLYSLRYIKYFDLIITISQSTKNDLIEHLGIDDQRIHVIAPVLADYFKRHSDQRVDEFRLQYGLDPNQRWIMISGQEFYKNHATALLAIKRLIDNGETNLAIVKTGREDQSVKTMAGELGLENRLKSIYLDSHKDLPLLYQSVSALLFPSWYEGFGMPVTEALACGTAVVCSNRGALPEAGGDLAIYTDVCDVDSVASGLANALRTQLNYADCKQFTSQFSTDNIASQIRNAYHLMGLIV